MNLPKFLRTVDEVLTEMSKEEMQSFLHQYACVLPEEERLSFLKSLTVMGKVGGTDRVASQRKVESDGNSELFIEMEKMQKILSLIDEGERCLSSEINEEWDDWYHSEEEEFFFTDPEEVLRDLQCCIELLHVCVDREIHKEGCELAELLSTIQVSTVGEYSDCDGSPFSISELFDMNLLNGPFEQVLTDSLYLTYMGNELQYKADELHRMMYNYRSYHVGLKALIQKAGFELPELQAFLPLWIECLGTHRGAGEERLLHEVWTMIETEEEQLDVAGKYAETHPELYRWILEEGKENGDPAGLYHTGKEALAAVPVQYRIRGEIALMTAEYAGMMNASSEAEWCWLEAFRSDTTVVNYLRLRLQVRDWNQYAAQISRIYEKLYWEEKSAREAYGFSMGEENHIQQDTYLMLLFFDAEFDEVLRLGMRETKALGWSYTFMKEGLSLFLLLLYEGETIQTGIRAMRDRVISSCHFEMNDYTKGTLKTVEEKNEKEYFWKLFQKWKSSVTLNEKDCTQWMGFLEKLIAVRTAGIMEANRRNYYGECAEFIAAFGEVRESRGEKGARQQFMESYRNQYPRRSRFIQELRECGMRK